MDFNKSSTTIDYCKYTNRLNSYASHKWPASAPQYIKSLAEAGFYYKGESDLVICFKCGIKLSDWSEEDEPLKRHEKVNKKCHFISQNTHTYTDIYKSKFYNPSMKSEKHRFESFAQCPVEKHWPSPERLSRSGLYYDNNKKQMICFCCGFMVDTWESSEQDPFVKHRDQSSDCLFIQGRLDKELENDKFDFKQTRLLQPEISDKNQSLKNPVEEENLNPTNHHLNGSQELLDNLSDIESDRHHTYNLDWTIPAIDYYNEHTRLQTFFSFPRNSPVSALSLCEAGFYYLGKDDEVMCYKCKVSLKCFEESDTAWGEHKRHSPKCPLVVKKFQNFHQEIQSRNTFYEMSAFPSAFFPNQRLYLSSNEIDHSFNHSSNGLPNDYSNRNSNNNLTFFRNSSADLPQSYPAELTPTKRQRTNKKFNSEFELKSASSPESDVNDSDHPCVVCMDKKAEVAFSPCGHLVTCVSCANGQKLCPMCRRYIEGRLRIYPS